MAATKEKTTTLHPAPDLPPGNVPALPRGQKVGEGLSLYNGRVMPQTFGQVMEFALMMCKGGLALPKHLRDNPGSCLRVIQQSMAWEMDPWAVASKTYSVNDILAYEAQLIAAVIKRWAPIKERVIPYVFTGEGGELQCSITVHHAETGEAIPYVSPKKKDISPQNSPLWKVDPQQQLGYYSIRALARRHFPEILLGVYDREEVLAMKDVTPDKPVTNFLNDDEAEPHEGEVLPPADEPNHERKYKPGDEVKLEPEARAFDLAKCIAHINSFTDHGALLGWWAEFNSEACPDAEWPTVLGAYEAKRDELEPL